MTPAAQNPPSPLVVDIERFLSSTDDGSCEDENADIINEPLQNTAFECHVCIGIFRGFKAPTSEPYSYVLGTVYEVMSSPCDAHKSLILWFIGQWEKEGFTDHHLIVFKQSSDCFLELFRHETSYPPFELISENISTPDTTEDETLRSSLQEHHVRIHGRGRILDPHWIRLDTIKRWYEMCKNEHGAACKTPPFSRDLDPKPSYFIDTQENCIVPATPAESYFALSYVWGEVACLRLEKANANALTSPGALRQEGIVDRIPLTILHAIDFTRLLGERYLWVDALCIIQDDDTPQKQEQISNMTAIYANASVAIIAAAGSNAADGLRGMRDVSNAVQRNICQEFVSFPPYGSIVQRIFRSKNDRHENDPIPPYYRRGWTFQEYYFSKRRIIFEEESVVWECSCTTWFEDVDCSDGLQLRKSWQIWDYQTVLASTVPLLFTFARIVQQYNKRQFTYEEDCLPAFSGALSALSKNFWGEFICGLPELFFDVSLLWQPLRRMQRRQRSHPHITAEGIPSWSWTGWTGLIDPWSWQSGCDFVKQGGMGKQGGIGAGITRETVPITKWYTGASPSSVKRQEISRGWYIQKELYRDPTRVLAQSWIRHASPELPNGKSIWTYPDCTPPKGFGSCFYTHIDCPSWQFWYPIQRPVPNVNLAIRDPANFLFGTVELAEFYTDGIAIHFHTPSVSLKDNNGQWAGVLRPHNIDDLLQAVPFRKQFVKLIAISFGRARNESRGVGFEEWDLEQRPKNTIWYEFYNVLWISQEQGISYRKGIGRVRKDIWEDQNLEKIDLVLG